jgi:2Fe-2S ferredoxin
MPKITYIDHAGEARSVDVKPGTTVMEGALQNNVPGIDADCGGACACATCHVYVAEQWLSRLPEATEMETAMLEYGRDVRPNSRLSCQLRVDATLDGLVVTTPESQH